MKILHLNYELGTDIRENAHGGIENFIYNLNNALIEAGHDSRVLARWDSKVTGLIPFRGAYTENPDHVKDEEFISAMNFRYCADALEHILYGEFDVIHSHGRPISAFRNIINTPTITTLHLPPQWFWHEDLGDINHPMNCFIAVSKNQRRIYEDAGFVVDAVIYNGIPVNDYPFSRTPGDYLLYLGRMSETKGPHIAINAAKRLNMPLKLAGGYANNQQKDFFETQIKPMVEGDIEYLGHVTEGKKDLLKNAKCVLLTSTCEESCPLVPIEAGATGTPTIAFNLGGSPEIIEHGKTGYIVDAGDIDGLCEAVSWVDEIDRTYCREKISKTFSLDRMVSDYLDLYHSLIQ